MLLFDIVGTSQAVTDTPSRLEKIAHLSACLRRLTPDEIEIGVSYLAGRLRQGNTGIGPALAHTAYAARPADEPSLTLVQVDEAFARIARTTGTGSSAERRRLFSRLFTGATKSEQSFLARLTLGELRQGALEGIMVEAIARAGELPPSDVRRALMLSGDLAAVGKAALQDSASGLKRFALQLLQPVQPMLAQPADDVADALRQLTSAAFEYKMDGARVQLHKAGQDVKVFTRTLNDVTGSAPEIVDAMKRLPARSIILDGEVLAFRTDGVPHPFQITMRRFGRKLNVPQMRKALPLTPFFFDCLHLDGEDLIDCTGQDRFARWKPRYPPAS